MKLFIHGVPDTGHMWTPLIEALDLSPGDYATPTMPGFGGASPVGFDGTKEAYRDWLVQTVDVTARTHGPLDLVGHDWGAPLCAMAALQRPDAIRTWTLINAVPEPSYQWHSLARKWQTPIVGELLMTLGSTANFQKQLVAAGMPSEMAAHEAPLIDRTMKRSILRLYRSAKDPGEWAADFSELSNRGLVLWGADDPFVPIEFAERFCDRWGIPLYSEAGVGHWGVCERPAAFATHLSSKWA